MHVFRFSVFKYFSLYLLLSYSVSLFAEDIVRAGTVDFIGDATTHYSHAQNLFRKNGIEVELVHHHAGFQILEKISKGELDIGGVAPTPLIMSILGLNNIDANFVIVGRISESTNVNHLVVANHTHFSSLKSLQGKRIGITKGTDSEFFWHNFTSAYELNEHDFDFVDIPVPEMAAAIKNESVDAVVSWSPYHVAALEATKGKGKLYGSNAFYTSNWLLVVRPEFLAQFPEKVVAYMSALNEAENILSEDPMRVAKAHSIALGTSAENLIEKYRDVYFELSMSESLILNLSLQARWLKQRHALTGNEIDVRAFFNSEPLTKVKPNAVTLLE